MPPKGRPRKQPEQPVPTLNHPTMPSELPHHPSSGDTVADDSREVDIYASNESYPTPGSLHEQSQLLGVPSSATTAIENISRESKKLLKAINEIALLGIKNQDLKLPKIVAIGDQSAGKSSAIAAISGITLPRMSGMCTRCPSQINLKASEDENTWTCTITIDKLYDYHGGGEWTLKSETSSQKFATITSSDNLEIFLRRAQAANLNPGQEPSRFISCDVEHLDERSVELSPNLVRLDICGSDCPDLTFYDLPGVVNQMAKREHEHLPQQIRSLVKEYIDPPNHIILLACSLDSDMENSSAASLVSEQANYRCIGLLTKPDRLPSGPVDNCEAVLRGETFQRGHGYFVTKQPDQVELARGQDYEFARRDEDRFFQQQSPWCDRLAQFKDRFGTYRLQEKLSDLLVSEIRASIPNLMRQVESRIAQINQDLASLPEPPRQCLLTIFNILSEFKNRMDKHLTGELPHNDFIYHWKDQCTGFADALHKMRPTLVVRTATERQEKEKAKQRGESSSSSQTEPIAIDDDSEDENHRSTNSNGKRPAAPTPVTPSKRKTTQNSASRAPSSANGSFRKRERSLDLYNSDLTEADSKYKLRLEDVSDILLHKNTSSIAGTSDHRADEYLIARSLEDWKTALDEFINLAKQHLQSIVKDILADLLKNWEKTPLSQEMPHHVESFIAGAFEKHRQQAYHVLRAEQLQPMTFQQKAMGLNIREETNLLKGARRTVRADLYIANQEAKTRKFIPENEREEKIRKLSDDLLGEDEYSPAIEAMGRVRGYYNVASASLVDAISKLMRLDVFESCRTNLAPSLERQFKMDDSGCYEEAQRLLEEDVDRANRRRHLLKEKEKWEKAKASLDALIAH